MLMGMVSVEPLSWHVIIRLFAFHFYPVSFYWRILVRLASIFGNLETECLCFLYRLPWSSSGVSCFLFQKVSTWNWQLEVVSFSVVKAFSLNTSGRVLCTQQFHLPAIWCFQWVPSTISSDFLCEMFWPKSRKSNKISFCSLKISRTDICSIPVLRKWVLVVCQLFQPLFYRGVHTCELS